MGVLLVASVEEEIDSVVAGIREFPVAKLVMIANQKNLDKCKEIEKKVAFLKIPAETKLVGDDLLRDYLKVVSEIAQGSSKYDDVYLNVGGGGKYARCAALSAAFVNGIKAFDVMEGMIIPLPVLKFNYCDLLSDAKLSILRTLEELGGSVDSLSGLSQKLGIEESLLSYHIRGSRNSKGLEELGLISVDRKERGKLKIGITTMGKLMITGQQAK